MTLTKKQATLRATILDKLYAKAPLSRIDIAKETGITPATTGSIIGDLIRQELVYEVGEAEDDTVGRKKTLLSLMPHRAYYLGVEISEKYLALVITDNLGEIQASNYSMTVPHLGNYPTSADLADFIHQFIVQHPDFPLTAIGVGLPGHVDFDLSPYIQSNNQHWQNLNLEELAQAFSLPVYFDNKSHCLTLAQRLYGQDDKNDHNFIVFHVANGIHCSYMYQGQIYGRQNFLIGEIGHTILNPQGEACTCGKRGCLQVYASESSLIAKAQTLYRVAQSTFLPSLVAEAEAITLATIMDACALGDTSCLQLIQQACHYLSIALSNLSQLIDSDAIYLDGQFFSYPLVDTLLHQELAATTPLFHKQKKIRLIPLAYSPLNIARAATSLCVKASFLSA